MIDGCASPLDEGIAYGRAVWRREDLFTSLAKALLLNAEPGDIMDIDLGLFRSAPLVEEPFPHLVLPGFVKPESRERINADYPDIPKAGSFPLPGLRFGNDFKGLIDDLNSAEMREAFEEKFQMSLQDRPTMITVRGKCGAKDGKIHTDSKTKLITVLIYMNPSWEESGGRLRLLRSGDNLEDVITEVPPLEGTLIAFRRTDNSWHGHKPFVGPRRVIQFNWVSSADVVRREQRRHRISAFFKKLTAPFSWN